MYRIDRGPDSRQAARPLSIHWSERFGAGARAAQCRHARPEVAVGAPAEPRRTAPASATGPETGCLPRNVCWAISGLCRRTSRALAGRAATHLRAVPQEPLGCGEPAHVRSGLRPEETVTLTFYVTDVALDETVEEGGSNKWALTTEPTPASFRLVEKILSSIRVSGESVSQVWEIAPFRGVPANGLVARIRERLEGRRGSPKRHDRLDGERRFRRPGVICSGPPLSRATVAAWRGERVVEGRQRSGPSPGTA